MRVSASIEKTCTKCLITKPVAEFRKWARGYMRWCKACTHESSQAQAKTKNEEPKQRRKYIKDKTTLHAKISFLTSDLFRNIKKRDFFSNRETTITKEHLYAMVESFCNQNYYVITHQKHPFKPSVDRIDNSKGYTIDNIRIVWQIENYCKNTYTQEDVIEFCKRKLGLM